MLKLPSILLYGSPGVGKTYLARAIALATNVASRLVSLAGSSDARMLLGTSAGYSTGAASLPAQVMAQTGCLAPFILLDELDKACASSANGSWSDGLLPFLEPVSARKLVDEFLLTKVDVSHVNWIATANDISRIPQTLLSRFACFEITNTSGRSRSEVIQLAGQSVLEDLGLAGALRGV